MFLRNAWYMAGWAREIDGAMLARRIADTPVVVYRREDGQPAALHDRCPHRFAPLSRGRLEGGVIECGYHGLRFDAGGKCVGNPHGDGRIPQAAQVQAFPLVEKYTLLWIWFGDPARADPSTIPDFSFLDDPGRGRVDGYLHVQANYLLETDNLLDLSHTQFVHPNFHFSEAILQGRHEVTQAGDTVHSNLWCPNGAASPMFAKRIPGYDGRSPVDQWMDMRWDPPCLLRLDTGITPAGRPREEGGQSFTAHILTPETETSTHYFFAHSRNFRVGDADMDEAIAHWQRVGFGEQDKPMLEAVQQAMGTTDLMSLKPVLLPIDTAAVRARRIVRHLLEAEEGAKR
ncbi:MAG: aromatic ring-hydroxylating dioxygenase subunit alpha [Pigmentiphaga sp.]|uniref:aromatic ring-hydroxylating dioxygenase subunit alpha n=1 Tax=Pigmentiphaga sp. TaxID=1977564 RepID=UPI0029A4A47D|nr:aromatic ring-hydroxylating dioxygenase subunit alpha [Pigmentiphaga sp.]MDX3906335.1 aromatic ring-hydroxylating dioxygenase subunit alpha [Pigmentiphaga sp.]